MAFRRVDESMALLNEVMNSPLDPSYAAAAQRRRASGLPGATRTGTLAVFVILAVVAFLFVVAALNLRATRSVVGAARAELVAQIEARQREGDELSAKATDLQAQVVAAQNAALGGPGGLLGQVGALELASGAVAVSGPGIQVSIDDAPGAAIAGNDPRDQGAPNPGRVTALDIQVAANGLWFAGAEAVSINGQRLTTHSAIRFAGQAILVDFRPLAPPYVLSAIGDPARLPAAFGSSTAGSYLKALRDNYKVRAEVASVDKLALPGVSPPTLRYAAPAPTGIPSSSTPTTRAAPPSSGSLTTTRTTP